MTTQQLEERSQALEARIATLEQSLAQMKQLMTNSTQRNEPWWIKVAGTFEHDPTFDEAEQLGREWRQSAE